MTREDAIKILKSKVDGHTDTSYEWIETVRMAIAALEKESRLLNEIVDGVLETIDEEIKNIDMDFYDLSRKFDQLYADTLDKLEDFRRSIAALKEDGQK